MANEAQVVESFSVRVYVGGSYGEACAVLTEEVWNEGLCVTVTPTKFVYTGGVEDGVVVGLEHYPRFPSSPDGITARAIHLAESLRDRLFQRTALVVTPKETIWLPRPAPGSNVNPTTWRRAGFCSGR